MMIVTYICVYYLYMNGDKVENSRKIASGFKNMFEIDVSLFCFHAAEIYLTNYNLLDEYIIFFCLFVNK